MAIKFNMTTVRGRWVSNGRKCGSQRVSMWWAAVIRSSVLCHYCVHALSSVHTHLHTYTHIHTNMHSCKINTLDRSIFGESVPMLKWLLLCMWSREVCGSCSPPTFSGFSVLSRQVKLPPYIFWLWHIDCEQKERLSSHPWCCCLLWSLKVC